MKQPYLAVIIIAVIIISGCASADKQSAPAGVESAPSETKEVVKESASAASELVWEGPYEKRQMRVTYPSDWGPTPTGSSNAVAFSPTARHEGKVDVTVGLGGCSKETASAIADSLLVGLKNKYSDDFRVFESSEMTLARYPAHKIVYGGSDNDGGAKKELLIVVAQSNIKLYRTLTYSSRLGVGSFAKAEEAYNKYLKAGEKVINSFEVLPDGKALDICAYG